MIPPKRRRFAPPSDSFWLKLLETPVSDLLRGRVTGRGNARRIIAEATLPEPVANAIWWCVIHGRIIREKRLRLAAVLTEWSQRQLASGRSTEDVAADVNVLLDISSPGKLQFPAISRRLPIEICDVIRQVTRPGQWNALAA